VIEHENRRLNPRQIAFPFRLPLHLIQSGLATVDELRKIDTGLRWPDLLRLWLTFIVKKLCNAHNYFARKDCCDFHAP
jgi:hypothetical protein